MTQLARTPPVDQLTPLDLVSPGQRGLNTVTSGTLMDSNYCVTATNAVIDTSGRLAARLGATAVTSTPITGTPSILSAFELNQGGGTYTNIVAWNGGISNNLINPNTGSLAGAVNVTNGRWFFQNFNNRCIGFQAGKTPIVYNPASTAPFTAGSNTAFVTIPASAGTAPTGGIGCAAFGRVWGVDGSDLQTIKYSGLLDETDWSTTDGNAGVIDMHTIWSNGTDQVTAIFAFNASLVVCGTKHIVFFTDGRGSLLGLDPTQAYVFDVLQGTGCVSQWTVQQIGETDVVFLSPNGIQSLQRLTAARNNPIETLSKYNRDLLLSQIQSETQYTVYGAYNNLTGFYILGLANNGLTWCFDMRRLYQDDVGAECSITTQWTTAITACYSDHSQNLYVARKNQGTICTYSGFTDEGTSFTFQYTSPWMTLGQQVSDRIKLLKRITCLLLTSGSQQFTIGWAVDFNSTTYSIAYSGQVSQTVPTLGAASLWGTALYGTSLWGATGTGLYLYKYPAHIRGQYYQFNFQTPVTGVMALQQLQFTTKIGRIA